MTSSDGGEVEVISAGRHNPHQGPDFLEARVRIGGTLLVGNVEIHCKSSDWVKHAHQEDPNYRNVILHVVWENDQPPQLVKIPCIELKDRVPLRVILNFSKLLERGGHIPCRDQINTVSDTIWEQWKGELLLFRMNNRARQIKSLLLRNNFHWEEVFWWLTARGFGHAVNAQAFELIAQSIPYAVILRHRTVLVQLEAILMGQAGLLNKDFSDDYAKMLKNEYFFYQRKYQLEPIHLPVNFLRMRPVNFPTIRLSQLAMLVYQNHNIFYKVKNASSLQEAEKLFAVTANDYWHYHYHFDEESVYKPKTLGKTMTNLLMINAVIPMLYAYGVIMKEEESIAKSLEWMNALPAEKNSIIRQFSSRGISSVNAAGSQALIELKATYCDQFRCLDCMVGKAILER